MTEAEAKTKLCPKMFGWVRYVEDQPITQGFGFCQGSACMAWRWETERGEVGRHTMTSPSHGEVVATEIGDRPSATEGYCGLAGRP